MLTWIAGFLILIVKLTIILLVVLFVAAYLVWVERKFLARLQIRYGPNRAGIFGLLQPIADIVKMITKEDTVPDGADKAFFLIAPAIVATTAFLMFSVVPFGGDITLWGHRIPLVVTDLNIGLLFVFAMSSLSVYGVALGGWASNSKYGLLGGIRGAAQMISYELSLGLSLIPVVMMAHSFSVVDIVESQQRYPFIIFQPLAFLIFVISAMAESKRTPFDLPEAENELIAGYHTEYSGMRFGLFFLGEYVHIMVFGGILAVLFLGGWRGPFLPPFVWLLIKMVLAALFMIWVRGTLPRLRYDQLMVLGWKVLIPLALVNILVTGAVGIVFSVIPEGAFTQPCNVSAEPEEKSEMESVWEAIKALFSGFATTFIHLFRKPITEQYPEYKRRLPVRARGRIILTRDPDGGERCVSCYPVFGGLPRKLHFDGGCGKAGWTALRGMVSNQLRPLHLLRVLRRSLPDLGNSAHYRFRILKRRHPLFCLRKGEPPGRPPGEGQGLQLLQIRRSGLQLWR